MRNIKETVTKVLCKKLGVDEIEVTPDAHLQNDLGADSLDEVELIMEFEREFNIGIPDDDAKQIKTVGDIFTYLENNVE